MSHQVMIVDDDANIRHMAQLILESEGLSVVVAPGGKACLEHLEKGFQGLIILDVKMPEMNGWEVIKAMVNKGYAEKSIVCMLTGQINPDPILEEYGKYVVEYIRKPFESDAFIATIKKLLAYLNK